MATLEKVPATLADVRADVHIYDMRGTNRTFRDYIASMHELRGKGGLGTRNGHLYRWNTLFNSLCSYHDLKIPNPLNMKQARFIEAGSRKRTVRSAMDPDLVEIVRDFNSRDDFAFSRAITKHYRAVNNPETGRVESHWFPAVAIAIDVLLELPFRSHCVRYMDTGQGDQLA